MCPHSHRGYKWLCSRLRTSGVLIEPRLAWPSATRSRNVYVDGTSQTRRLNTQVKSYELREGFEPDAASLPIATSPWPDGEYAEVRSSQVESGEGCPALLLAKQRPQAGWTQLTWLLGLWRQTDRDRQQRLDWPGWPRCSQLIPAVCFWHLVGWRWIFHILVSLQRLCLKKKKNLLQSCETRNIRPP